MKFNELGRSMVEMLGVLAIIGVLSVGAISGYSKAMMKYKLNRQTEQIGSILDYISIHDEQLSSVGYGSFNATQLLIKMGIIPTEMIKPNDDMYIYDIFGNSIRIYHSQSDDGIQYYGLWMNIYQSTHDICMNMYQISKLRSSNLRRAVVSKGDDTLGTIVYGDAYCSQNVQCLKNLTLSEIDELCNFCDDTGTQCRFQILWGYKTAN